MHHIAAGLAAGLIMLVLALLLDHILKKESLGGGDIKLFAVMGLYLGFIGSYALLMFSSILGLVIAAVFRKNRIPFGPAIAAAGYFLTLYGEEIAGWYMGFL